MTTADLGVSGTNLPVWPHEPSKQWSHCTMLQRPGDGQQQLPAKATLERRALPTNSAAAVLYSRGTNRGNRRVVTPTLETINNTLHWASKYGTGAAVTLLIKFGADIEAEGEDGLKPLPAASGKGNEEVVRILLNRGADVNVKIRSGTRPIDFAKQHGHKEVVKLLQQAEKKKQIVNRQFSV
ncbi:hypothetical protein BaRGS_00031936 [Batillaria attramentaria]|uniref:Ankyrin n=1 Tax=Batillaria attramentaria TaxID=370345 RepID=A0ABD0JP51_9CAEN